MRYFSVGQFFFITGACQISLYCRPSSKAIDRFWPRCTVARSRLLVSRRERGQSKESMSRLLSSRRKCVYSKLEYVKGSVSCQRGPVLLLYSSLILFFLGCLAVCVVDLESYRSDRCSVLVLIGVFKFLYHQSTYFNVPSFVFH
jgi:hypothetical protein